MQRNPKLESAIEVLAGGDSLAAVAYAVLRLAEAQADVAAALRQLGLADAATPMGALEVLAKEVSGIASAIRDHGEH